MNGKYIELLIKNTAWNVSGFEQLQTDRLQEECDTF